MCLLTIVWVMEYYMIRSLIKQTNLSPRWSDMIYPTRLQSPSGGGLVVGPRQACNMNALPSVQRCLMPTLTPNLNLTLTLEPSPSLTLTAGVKGKHTADGLARHLEQQVDGVGLRVVAHVVRHDLLDQRQQIFHCLALLAARLPFLANLAGQVPEQGTQVFRAKNT